MISELNHTEKGWHVEVGSVCTPLGWCFVTPFFATVTKPYCCQICMAVKGCSLTAILPVPKYFILGLGFQILPGH